MTMTNGAATPIAAHRFKRQRNEHYVEPGWCSERLLDVEDFPEPVWDPSCGWGRVRAALWGRQMECVSTDLVGRGCGTRLDFLEAGRMRGRARSIVCNPPFDLMQEFAEHALELGADKVAMIALLRRLPAAGWLKRTPLVRVWLLTPRPSMPTGGYIRRGGKVGGGTQDFCWLVWERGHNGAPEMRWLKRDG